jgi:hypothetical protein
MPRVGFEPRISASKQAKIVHALDRAATVTSYRGSFTLYYYNTFQILSEY